MILTIFMELCLPIVSMVNCFSHELRFYRSCFVKNKHMCFSQYVDIEPGQLLAVYLRAQLNQITLHPLPYTRRDVFSYVKHRRQTAAQLLVTLIHTVFMLEESMG